MAEVMKLSLFEVGHWEYVIFAGMLASSRCMDGLYISHELNDWVELRHARPFCLNTLSFKPVTRVRCFLLANNILPDQQLSL